MLGENLPYNWPGDSSIIIKSWQREQLCQILGCDESYVEKKNNHHPFASALSQVVSDLEKINYRSSDFSYSFVISNLEKAINEIRGCCAIGAKGGMFIGKENIGPSDMKEVLDTLLDEMQSERSYVVPEFLHNLFNSVFAGDFTPIEVILKLEWIFYYKREYNRNNKKFLMQFLSAVRILGKEKCFDQEEIQEILEIIHYKGDFRNVDMLGILGLTMEDIRVFLKRYFFHPCWGNRDFNRHFLLMLFLKKPEHINMTNLIVYLRYYRYNRIDEIFTGQNPDEVEIIRFALDLFLVNLDSK